MMLNSLKAGLCKSNSHVMVTSARSLHGGVRPFSNKPDQEKADDGGVAHAMTLPKAARSVWRNLWKGAHNLPGYSILPLIGSRCALWWDPEYERARMHLFYEHCFKKFGPIFKICHPGGGKQVFIREAEDVRKVFTNKHIITKPERAHFDAMIDIRTKGLNRYFRQQGIAMSSGDSWANIRSRMDDLLLKQTLGREFILCDEVTRAFMKRIAQVRQGADCKVPLNFLHEIKRWSIEAMHYSIMGLKYDNFTQDLALDSPLAAYMHDAEHSNFLMEKIEFDVPFWKMMKTPLYTNLQESMLRALKFMLKCVETRIHQIRVDPSSARGTTLEILLQENTRSQNEIFESIHDILGGGADVTPRHSAKVIYALGRHPECQDKLRKEVLDVMGPDPDAPMTLDMVNKMPYLKAFTKETLRVYNTSNTANRRVVEPLQLRGYEIPNTWSVTMALYSMGLLERNVKEAHKFLPERFLGEDNPLHPKPFGYMPFSFGKRQCVGRKVAEVMFWNLAARVVQRFRVDMKHAMPTVSVLSIRLDGDHDFNFYDHAKKDERKRGGLQSGAEQK